MPTRARSAFWWLAALLVALLVAGIGMLLLVMPPERGEMPTATALAQRAEQRPMPTEIASPFGNGTAVLGPDVELPGQPFVSPGSSLPGLSYSELMDVKRTLEQGADPGGDFKRSADSMLFKDAVQRLRQLSQEAGDKAEMQALAHMIDTALPQQLSLGDVDAPESRLVKALVLGALEPDPARRRSAYARWLAQQVRAAAASAPVTVTPERPAHP